MAEAIEFPQKNFTWDPAPGTEDRVRPLHVHRSEVPERGTQSISCWRLSPEEMLEVLRTGCVWLFVLGQHTPVCVIGVSPFPEPPVKD